jgi:ribonuclease ZC3H12
LGYTERLVQAALARLGPNPAQNELLAELIKLGAQQGTKGDFALDLHNDGGSLFSPTHDSSSSLTTDDSPSTPLSTLSTLSTQSSTGAGGTTLRPVVIDGSNVAMSHGNKEVFSCRGLRLCVDWFKNRGHKEITVFVPKWRKESSRPDNPIKDQEILNELEKERMLVFTPSRLVGGKRMVCYDDRYILKLAADNDGIVVSNDNYRDLVQESSEFKRVVEERILMFSFVNDRFMPPDDPLGRSGPTLDNFLRIQPRKGDPPPPCPYGKKCTYGNKCKFHHPERGSMPHKSVTERLTEYAQKQIQARSSCEGGRPLVQGKSLSVPLSNNSGDTSPVGGGGGGVGEMRRKTLCRARSSVPDSQHLAGPGAGSLAQMEQMHLNHPYLQQTPSGWGELAQQQQQQQQFPKSHSIENISPRDYSAAAAAQIWQTQQQQQQQQTGDPDGSINLHRKLQRQLTLNPAGCDPRIYQLQRSGMHQQQSSGPPQLSPHRPLQPSLSGPRTHHPAAANQWDMHQVSVEQPRN